VVLRNPSLRWTRAVVPGAAMLFLMVLVPLCGTMLGVVATATAIAAGVAAIAEWRTVVLVGEQGLFVRDGLRVQRLAWPRVDGFVARRHRPRSGVQVFARLRDGREVHLRAVSGGLFADGARVPAVLVATLHEERARERARRTLGG
jgi:hypothetical protein